MAMFKHFAAYGEDSSASNINKSYRLVACVYNSDDFSVEIPFEIHANFDFHAVASFALSEFAGTLPIVHWIVNPVGVGVRFIDRYLVVAIKSKHCYV